MSYLKQGSVVDTIGTSLVAAGDILTDPALPRIAQLVIKLHQMQQPAPKAGSPTVSVKGIGLSGVVKPLEAYVWVQQNKWVIPVGIIGALLLPGLLGYRLGKR